MVAERPLQAFFAQLYIALQHDFGVGRHHQVAGDGLDHFHALAAQKAGQQHLVQIGRQGGAAAPDRCRVAAQGHRYIHPFQPQFAAQALVVRRHFVRLPVHPGGAAVINLHPVSAVVVHPGFRVAGDDQRQGDERPAIQRPALEDGIAVEVHRVAMQRHFLARGAAHGFGAVRGQLRQLPQGTQLVQQAGRRALRQLQQRGDALRQFVQRLHAQSGGHPAIGTEHIDEYGSIKPLRLLEQQRRPARLNHPAGDFGNLQFRVDRRGDAGQFPPFFEAGDEFPQIVEFHSRS